MTSNRLLASAEAAQQAEVDNQVSQISLKVRTMNIEGNGICYVCPAETQLVPYQGRMIYSRFCGVECRDAYAEGARNPDNIPVSL